MVKTFYDCLGLKISIGDVLYLNLGYDEEQNFEAVYHQSGLKTLQSSHQEEACVQCTAE